MTPGEGKRNPGRIPRGRDGSGVHDANMAGHEAGVEGSSWTGRFLDALEAALSRERLHTCFDAAQGDERAA